MAKPGTQETGAGAACGIQSAKPPSRRIAQSLQPRTKLLRTHLLSSRRAPGAAAPRECAPRGRPAHAPGGEELTAPLAQHPADLLLEVPARLERGERCSESGRRPAAAVGIGLHEEDVPAVLLEPPAGRERGVAPGPQAHGEQRVLLQAPGFDRPHLVHLHQIGRLVPGLAGAGRQGRGPGGHGPVGGGQRVPGGRLALTSPRPCLARRRLPVECPLLPPRWLHLSLDHHRGALSQLLHRAHAGRGRVAHRGPRGSRLVAGGRPRRQGRGAQQQQRQQRRRRAGGGAGARGPRAGTPGAARGASPSHGARCVRAAGCRFGLCLALSRCLPFPLSSSPQHHSSFPPYPPPFIYLFGGGGVGELFMGGGGGGREGRGGWNHRKAKRYKSKKKKRNWSKIEKQKKKKKPLPPPRLLGVTGPPGAAAAAPEPCCRGCCHRRRTWRWRSCSAGSSPLCEVMLRRLLRLRASGWASARGREPWRRSCVPGNRWVAAAAAAPCASPACLPGVRTRPAPAFPMLVPEPGRGVGPPWSSLPRAPPPSVSPGLLQWEAGRQTGCSPSGLRRFTGEWEVTLQ